MSGKIVVLMPETDVLKQIQDFLFREAMDDNYLPQGIKIPWPNYRNLIDEMFVNLNYCDEGGGVKVPGPYGWVNVFPGHIHREENSADNLNSNEDDLEKDLEQTQNKDESIDRSE